MNWLKSEEIASHTAFFPLTFDLKEDYEQTQRTDNTGVFNLLKHATAHFTGKRRVGKEGNYKNWKEGTKSLAMIKAESDFRKQKNNFPQFIEDEAAITSYFYRTLGYLNQLDVQNISVIITPSESIVFKITLPSNYLLELESFYSQDHDTDYIEVIATIYNLEIDLESYFGTLESVFNHLRKSSSLSSTTNENKDEVSDISMVNTLSA